MGYIDIFTGWQVASLAMAAQQFMRVREREKQTVCERESECVLCAAHANCMTRHIIAWRGTSCWQHGGQESMWNMLAKIDNESAHKLCSILFGGANAKNKTVNNIVNSTDNGNNNKNLNERIHVTFINYQKRLCCLSRCDFNCHLFLIATVSLSLSLLLLCICTLNVNCFATFMHVSVTYDILFTH